MFKYFAGIVGIGLLVAFIAPVAVKLKEIPLILLALIGIGLAAADLWQTIRAKDR